MTAWTPVSSGWCEAGPHRKRARWAGPLTPSGGNLWCGACKREQQQPASGDRDQIAAIRDRADSATDGPWVMTHPDSAYTSLIDPDQLPVAMSDGRMPHCDAEFIAAARSDVPWLLDRLAAATAEVERVREAVTDIAERVEEWARGDGGASSMLLAKWHHDLIAARDGKPLIGKYGESTPPLLARQIAVEARLAAATERADKAEVAVADDDERIEAAVEWGRTNAQEINVLGLFRALRVIAEIPHG